MVCKSEATPELPIQPLLTTSGGADTSMAVTDLHSPVFRHRRWMRAGEFLAEAEGPMILRCYVRGAD